MCLYSLAMYFFSIHTYLIPRASISDGGVLKLDLAWFPVAQNSLQLMEILLSKCTQIICMSYCVQLRLTFGS